MSTIDALMYPLFCSSSFSAWGNDLNLLTLMQTITDVWERTKKGKELIYQKIFPTPRELTTILDKFKFQAGQRRPRIRQNIPGLANSGSSLTCLKFEFVKYGCSQIQI